MKTLLQVLLLTIFLTVCVGKIRFDLVNAESTGSCVYNGITLAKGRNKSPFECAQLYCHENGMVSVTNCSTFTRGYCKVDIDVTKPFPQCCQPYFECMNSQGNYNIKDITYSLQ